MDAELRDGLLCAYFFSGLKYRDICSIVKNVHGINISVRQFKRVLKKKNLRRRGISYSEIVEAVKIIQRELSGSGVCLGYRSMTNRVRTKYSIFLPRNLTRVALSILDPEASNQRWRRRIRRRKYYSKGPNYCWHIDGHDKLKQYGFPIHGCIDGFSRKVLWLKINVSNNDPNVVTSNFLECVGQLQGCPRLIRADKGTENSMIAYLQPFLRRNCQDSFLGFQYGKSTSNQRIESWWGELRRGTTDWWMNVFKMLKHEGFYNETNYIHVQSMRYCFGTFLQSDLDQAVKEWNNHYIRKSRSDTIQGVPNLLYHLSPNLPGFTDYLTPISETELTFLQSKLTVRENFVHPAFITLANVTMEEHNLHASQNMIEAIELYITLTGCIKL